MLIKMSGKGSLIVWINNIYTKSFLYQTIINRKAAIPCGSTLYSYVAVRNKIVKLVTVLLTQRMDDRLCAKYIK